jgi:hypothetical protein
MLLGSLGFKRSCSINELRGQGRPKTRQCVQINFNPLASSKSRTLLRYHKLLQRTAFIADLVRKAPAGFGRTTLMKCLYFLRTVRRVPLGLLSDLS